MLPINADDLDGPVPEKTIRYSVNRDCLMREVRPCCACIWLAAVYTVVSAVAYLFFIQLGSLIYKQKFETFDSSNWVETFGLKPLLGIVTVIAAAGFAVCVYGAAMRVGKCYCDFRRDYLLQYDQV